MRPRAGPGARGRARARLPAGCRAAHAPHALAAAQIKTGFDEGKELVVTVLKVRARARLPGGPLVRLPAACSPRRPGAAAAGNGRGGYPRGEGGRQVSARALLHARRPACFAALGPPARSRGGAPGSRAARAAGRRHSPRCRCYKTLRLAAAQRRPERAHLGLKSADAARRPAGHASAPRAHASACGARCAPHPGSSRRMPPWGACCRCAP